MATLAGLAFLKQSVEQYVNSPSLHILYFRRKRTFFQPPFPITFEESVLSSIPQNFRRKRTFFHPPTPSKKAYFLPSPKTFEESVLSYIPQNLRRKRTFFQTPFPWILEERELSSSPHPPNSRRKRTFFKPFINFRRKRSFFNSIKSIDPSAGR